MTCPVTAAPAPAAPGAAAALSPTGCPVSARAAAFDPFGPAYQADPGAALSWARAEEPVFWSPALGYWVVARYEDQRAVFRDPILFSPANVLEKLTPAGPEAQQILADHGFALSRTMVNEDEPDHMERRRLLMDAFLPSNLAKHEPMIRRLTREKVDAFIARGHADLAQELCHEVPLSVALAFLGVPDDDAATLKQFAVAHTLNTWGRPTPEEQLEIARKVGAFWTEANRILDRMMADPTGEGWMYDTVRAHFDHPDIVPESYLRSMMMAILAAAHETTSLAAAKAFRMLLSDRAAWEEICAEPARIPGAVEECLRLAGSVIAWRRVATADCEIGGVQIPKGGKILVVQASANVDPERWEDPLTLDIHREDAIEHLTFGYGAHQCLGKNIGRMEIRIFLEECARRLPHMRLDPGQDFASLPNLSFHGPQSVRASWDPARNPEAADPRIREAAVDFPVGAPSRDALLRPARIVAAEGDAPGVKRLRLADPHGRPLPRWSAGAHVDLVAGGFRRKYSLCGAQDADGGAAYEIAIQADPDGTGGSRHFTRALKAGDLVQIAGPRNHFRLDEGAAAHILVAGGIGITPILAMADRLKALGKPYALHYCVRSRAAAPLLARVEAEHGHALALHVTQEGTRLDLSALAPPPGSQVCACGPARMLDALDALAAGWDAAFTREHFTAAAPALDPANEHAFAVELADSGLTVEVRADQTVHDALAAAGIDVPKECGEGLCGTCEAAVLSGAVDHRDRVLSRAERAAGDRMMTCCSRATGDKLRLAL
ncbi:cytochrome P450/oxidoreductase [Rhodovulum sp. DZ06]|uniref:cytochrome P450/oxidoreductase n=1 Tax=Rhodovulum sp. DZ06 TaxID=3425126 RepID=UPI003D332DAE